MAFQPTTIEAGHDPRVHHSEKEEQLAYTHEDDVLPDGSTPNIETYMYSAKIQRDKEAALSAKEDAERGRGSLISRAFEPSRGFDGDSVTSAYSGEKTGAASSEDGGSAVVTEYEFHAASSALRMATWGSVFYLITTGHVKIIYHNVLVELFSFPELTTTRGKYYFSASVIVYWSIAFIIGSAIPQFSNISVPVAAVCIFDGSSWTPTKVTESLTSTTPTRIVFDTWHHLSRWKRGFFKGFFFNVWNILLTLACLACAILSSYSSIKAIIAAFNTSRAASSFGCKSPLDRF
ncbi:hypothetical protein AZE42_11763 [Rhizopogon vesiculosus]|uniref:Uncharacterized protein n=1 Tax=Rhizopogon vesiculosus TaxID=180088 RepID=A0A1J8Q3D7_9AGAM|nr:hypothetical protein AZE42_11763 [Rhizopogon vesiculosus]